MIRRRQVLPDETGIVSRDALVEALVDGATMLDFAGGVLSVVTQRAPTALEGEMVTVGAVIEWRHDARVQPRPEQFEAGRPPARVPDPEPEPELPEPAADGTESLEPGEPDGFDYSKLEAEDIEEPVEVAR